MPSGMNRTAAAPSTSTLKLKGMTAADRRILDALYSDFQVHHAAPVSEMNLAGPIMCLLRSVVRERTGQDPDQWARTRLENTMQKSPGNGDTFYFASANNGYKLMGRSKIQAALKKRRSRLQTAEEEPHITSHASAAAVQAARVFLFQNTHPAAQEWDSLFVESDFPDYPTSAMSTPLREQHLRPDTGVKIAQSIKAGLQEAAINAAATITATASEDDASDTVSTTLASSSTSAAVCSPPQQNENSDLDDSRAQHMQTNDGRRSRKRSIASIADITGSPKRQCIEQLQALAGSSAVCSDCPIKKRVNSFDELDLSSLTWSMSFNSKDTSACPILSFLDEYEGTSGASIDSLLASTTEMPSTSRAQMGACPLTRTISTPRAEESGRPSVQIKYEDA